VPGQEAIMSKSSGRRTRRVFNPEFKAKVALAALREDRDFVCRLFSLGNEEAVFVRDKVLVADPLVQKCRVKPTQLLKG
jgi:transposase-like protein